MIRRLIPGRDIYRIEKWSSYFENPWRVTRYTHGLSNGFIVSEHPTRDQARAAKIKHEEAYDAARGR